MNTQPVIQAENVAKKYCKSISHSIAYGIADVARNTLGLSTHSGQLRPNEFWSVQNVSFELRKGETLGIIGPNGSGKTTLLKMLNGIFWPDKGKITTRGKVGALIEVGAGFHPMLTGRENIYVNGAILGMSKAEIDSKFQSIVDFADIGDFLDVQVKHYSSGMYVRLGFAIAIHCEPEILLIDEILAVGDVAFRNKCYDKLSEIKKQNVAIVFVSHDLFSVGKFCDRGILLDQGEIKSYGEINKVIMDYQALITRSQKLSFDPGRKQNLDQISNTHITNVCIINIDGQPQSEFQHHDCLAINIQYQSKLPIHTPHIEISIINHDGLKVCTLDTLIDNIAMPETKNDHGIIKCAVPDIALWDGRYYINVHLYDKDHIKLLDYRNGHGLPQLQFTVLPSRAGSIIGEYGALYHFYTQWWIDQKLCDQSIDNTQVSK